MADVNQNDVLQVTVEHENTRSGDQVNRYQLRYNSSAGRTAGEVLDDISGYVEALYTIVQAIISVANVLREVGVFNLTQTALMGSTDAGLYVGGADSGNEVPQGAAPYIHFKTSTPRVILSKYLPSGTIIDMDPDGTLSSGAMVALLLFGDYLIEPQDIGGHEYEYGYLSPKTLSFVVPTLAAANHILAYQRRRKEGRGS